MAASIARPPRGRTMAPMLTCGTCKHRFELPPDPLALGGDHPGECRRMPPGVVALQLRSVRPSPLTGQVEHRVQVHAAYPPVGPETPACALYELEEGA